MWVITSIIELAAILLLLWGFKHEDKFIAFELKIADEIRLALLKNKRFVAWLNDIDE